MVEEENTEQTSAALEPARELLMPLTGELIPVGDTMKGAEALDMLKRHRDQVSFAVSQFTEVVVAESKRQGTKTLEVGTYSLKVSADSEIEWDIEELQKLRAAGLPEERYLQLVTEVVSYKVDGRVAKQLEGASEEYAAIVRAARKRNPKSQYVTVSQP